MTAEAGHHTSGTLPLAIGLAATAGFVDAYIYTQITPVFVANMSGNLVHLGIAAGHDDWQQVAGALVALVGFLIGIVVATSHVDARLRRGRMPDPMALLMFESVLLLALTSIVLLGHVRYSPLPGPVDDLIVVIGGTSMGMQAVALRRVGQVAVSTTYGTGAVVRLGEKVALAVRRAPRPQQHRRRATILVLTTVLGGYVGGAVLAAAIGNVRNWLIIAAVAPLIAALALAARQRHQNR
jgi:uncharacterized membrane protein YoaK (UPF0700 family)